jgi:hypothetical protein
MLDCTFGPLNFTILQFWPPSLKVAFWPLNFIFNCKSEPPKFENSTFSPQSFTIQQFWPHKLKILISTP